MPATALEAVDAVVLLAAVDAVAALAAVDAVVALAAGGAHPYRDGFDGNESGGSGGCAGRCICTRRDAMFLSCSLKILG